MAYNACGTLSHILSDPNCDWPDSLHEKREEIERKMVIAVGRWDESSERNINYRSLKEFLPKISAYIIAIRDYH